MNNQLTDILNLEKLQISEELQISNFATFDDIEFINSNLH